MGVGVVIRGGMRIVLLGCLVLVACTKEKLPELYLLQGNCEVQVKTSEKDSDIYVDGILIGHGEASTKVPCGQKKIEVEAPGKWVVEEYKVAEAKIPLELTYKLVDRHEVKDWALSAELVAQLKKGQGPVDIKNPKYKEVLEAKAKERAEEGYAYTPAELMAAAKKLFGSDDAGAAGGAVKIDPNTNFDDPKTWM